MSLKTKIIIPAAGYGTRIGSPEAKEMLTLSGTQPLIDFSLNIAKLNQATAHVITRKEKKSLISYLENKENVSLQTIEPSKEWPDTILQSKPFWEDYNLLILPDTRFAPLDRTTELLQALENYEMSVGYFNPDALNTWGAFDSQSTTYKLIEKPNIIDTKNLYAWGIIGFRKNVGEELFRLILESTLDHQFKTTSFSYQAIQLDYFEDLTR